MPTTKRVRSEPRLKMPAAWRRVGGCASLLKVSTAVPRKAVRAGNQAASAAIRGAAAKPSAPLPRAICAQRQAAGHSPVSASPQDLTPKHSTRMRVKPMPAISPAKPPSNPIKAASPATMPNTWRRPPPTARSRPISRRRSFTLITVVLITPSAPATTAISSRALNRPCNWRMVLWARSTKASVFIS